MNYKSIEERLQTRCSIVAERMAIQMKNIYKEYDNAYTTRMGLYLELMGAYALDLCLWELGYSLIPVAKKTYRIEMYHGANEQGWEGLDFLILLSTKVNEIIPILIEAKNWKKQPIDKIKYKRTISDRFWDVEDVLIVDSMNMLLADRLVIMNKENIPQLQGLIQKHRDFIYIVSVPKQLTIDMADSVILQKFLYGLVINLMKQFRRIAKIRRISVINYSKKRDYIRDALDIGMPTWLIEKECDTTRPFIYNQGKQYKSKIATRYRKIYNQFI